MSLPWMHQVWMRKVPSIPVKRTLKVATVPSSRYSESFWRPAVVVTLESYLENDAKIHRERYFRLPIIKFVQYATCTHITNTEEISKGIGGKLMRYDRFFMLKTEYENHVWSHKWFDTIHVFSEKIIYTAFWNSVRRYVLCYACSKPETVLYKSYGLLNVRCLRCGLHPRSTDE